MFLCFQFIPIQQLGLQSSSISLGKPSPWTEFKDDFSRRRRNSLHKFISCLYSRISPPSAPMLDVPRTKMYHNFHSQINIGKGGGRCAKKKRERWNVQSFLRATTCSRKSIFVSCSLLQCILPRINFILNVIQTNWSRTANRCVYAVGKKAGCLTIF